jgi:hypothetical protein
MGGESVNVPLFSEWDGPMYNHDVDMDHFWTCVAWYFPEDQPAEVLSRIRDAILPATGPDDPIFRVPKPRRAAGGGESVGTGGGGESVYGGVSDNEDVSLSDWSYETDDHEDINNNNNLPLVLHRYAYVKPPHGTHYRHTHIHTTHVNIIPHAHTCKAIQCLMQHAMPQRRLYGVVLASSYNTASYSIHCCTAVRVISGARAGASKGEGHKVADDNVIVIDDDGDKAAASSGKGEEDEEKRFKVGLAFGSLLAACELRVSRRGAAAAAAAAAADGGEDDEEEEDDDEEEQLAAEIVPIEYARERQGV